MAPSNGRLQQHFLKAAIGRVRKFTRLESSPIELDRTSVIASAAVTERNFGLKARFAHQVGNDRYDAPSTANIPLALVKRRRRMKVMF